MLKGHACLAVISQERSSLSPQMGQVPVVSGLLIIPHFLDHAYFTTITEAPSWRKCHDSKNCMFLFTTPSLLPLAHRPWLNKYLWDNESLK
jgi:hypothetical protein